MTMVLAGVIFTSCNNIENLREPIESLASDWEGTTAQVTEFLGTLQQSQTTLQDRFAKMVVPEGLMLDEDNRQHVEALREGYQEQLAGLSDLSQTVNDFVGQWQEKTGVLQQLREGLSAGTLDTDAMAMVTDLQSVATEAKEGLEEWQGDVADISENSAGIFEEFRALIRNAQGN